MSGSVVSVSAIGTVPGIINENARPGDWVGALTLSGGVLEVALAGPEAAFFDVAFDRARQAVTLTPAFAFDAEALGARVFTLALDVRTAAGWQRLAQSWPVTLSGFDDTPPEALRFATGGVVLATDPGVAIGTLIADDPDTAGPLAYAVAGPDSADFEIVGNVLRLRAGKDLRAFAGQVREVLVTVFDGFPLPTS